jgi:hypothetical protein
MMFLLEHIPQVPVRVANGVPDLGMNSPSDAAELLTPQPRRPPRHRRNLQQRVAEPDLPGFGTQSELSLVAPQQPRGFAPHHQRLDQPMQALPECHLPTTLVDHQTNDARAFKLLEAARADLPVSLIPFPPTIERRIDTSVGSPLWKALGSQHNPRSAFKHKHRKHRVTDAESSPLNAVVSEEITHPTQSLSQPDQFFHGDLASTSSVNVASSVHVDDKSDPVSSHINSASMPAGHGSLMQQPSLRASDVYVDQHADSFSSVPAHMDLAPKQNLPTAPRRRRQSELRLPLSVETDAFTPSREARAHPFAIATEADGITPATPPRTNSVRGTSLSSPDLSSSQLSMLCAESSSSSIVESSLLPPTFSGSMDRRKVRMQASPGNPSMPTVDLDESLSALIRQAPMHTRRASVSSASPAPLSPMPSVAPIGTVIPHAGVNPLIPTRERRDSLSMMAGGSTKRSSPAFPPAGYSQGKAWSLSSEDDQDAISVSSRHKGTLFAPSVANEVDATPTITSQRPQRSVLDPGIQFVTSIQPALRTLSHANDEVLEMRGNGGFDDETTPVIKTSARSPPVIRTLSHTVDEVLEMRRDLGFDSASSDDETGAVVCEEPQPVMALRRKKPTVVRTLSAEISEVLDMADTHGIPSMAASVARSGIFMGYQH